jgi:hypothetical protein
MAIAPGYGDEIGLHSKYHINRDLADMARVRYYKVSGH